MHAIGSSQRGTAARRCLRRFRGHRSRILRRRESAHRLIQSGGRETPSAERSFLRGRNSDVLEPARDERRQG
ncbi:MAG: hypothetical protein MZU84_09480 [Sphingobacterium sp.]|nr:hypothetical protein [Sphingobacterium sp.]